MMSNLISRIGDLPLPKITKNHIQEFVAYELDRGRKPGGVSDDLRTFRAAFNWAIEEKFMVINPVVGIKFPRVPRRLPRRLSPTEFTNLLKAIDREGDKKIALTLILTGMRISELLSLTWANVKIEQSYIFVKGKGGNEREIPIGSYLKEIFLTVPRYEESHLVFPGMLLRGRTLTPKGKISYTRIRARFSVYFAKAGIEGYGVFHRLRHSFASIIADSGHTSFDLKQLLGHASTSTTEIYTWLGGTRLRSTIEALNDGVREMIEQS